MHSSGLATELMHLCISWYCCKRINCLSRQPVTMTTAVLTAGAPFLFVASLLPRLLWLAPLPVMVMSSPPPTAAGSTTYLFSFTQPLKISSKCKARLSNSSLVVAPGNEEWNCRNHEYKMIVRGLKEREKASLFWAWKLGRAYPKYNRLA